MEKTCKKCGIIKSISDFPKSVRSKDGYSNKCKLCINKLNKEYRDTNSEKVKQDRKRYYQDNIEKMRSEKRAYYKTHKEQKAEYDKQYRVLNKERVAKYKKDWEVKNKNNPLFIIKRALRKRLNLCIPKVKKGDKHSSDFLGCTFEEYKIYLESKFTEGMTWDNYGQYGWHIDHIIPCNSFNLLNEEDQKKCFHYTNTQPLWWKDNLKKGYTYDTENSDIINGFL